jgi:5,6-dimethylbenzimidazole synthase
MEFRDVLTGRRSCRAFTKSPVPQADVTAIIQAGCQAPSPLNLQPWEFVIITDDGVKKQIRTVADAAKQAVVDADGPSWVNKYGMDFLETTPLMIAVTANPKKGGLGNFFNQPLGAYQAGSACVQNMMLAATELGYESLWFTFFDPDKLAPVLGIPENLQIAGLVLVGKPMEPSKAPPRKDPKVHDQKYSG